MGEKMMYRLATAVLLFSVWVGRPFADIRNERSSDMTVYAASPLSGEKVLPDTQLFSGDISDEIAVLGTPGEYVPAGFVVKSGKGDILSLRVTVSDLKGDAGVIYGRNVDIRTVKCWYQGGEDTVCFQNKKVLTPELLLKDDSLVRVDCVNKENYLKMAPPEGEPQYVWMSWGKKTELFARFPEQKDFDKYAVVNDSKDLRPVDILSGANKQFYVLIQIPAAASPGFYYGNIGLTSESGVSRELRLKLRVLPFKLEEPPFISSIYYAPGKDLPDSPRCRIQMENLVAHGVTNPALIRNFNEDIFRAEFKLRADCGIPVSGRPVFWIDASWKGTGVPQDQKELEALKSDTRQIVDFCRSCGVTDVYRYGVDEVSGEALKKERLGWQAVHEAGGKVWVSGYATHFNTVGDILDLINYQGWPNPDQVKLWHGAGHKVSCYYNPQAGVENPEMYRRNYGLLLWKMKYDMACTYAYVASMWNGWNDFDHPLYKDNSFVYQTRDGIVDTLSWEGYRTGIDDARYVRTLEGMIEDGKKSGDPALRKCAAEAGKWLDELDVENSDLDNIRLKMVRFMLKLKGKEK